MKAVTGKQLARALERHGWELRRITGSHHIYAKADTAVRLSVPIHGNRALAKKTYEASRRAEGLASRSGCITPAASPGASARLSGVSVGARGG